MRHQVIACNFSSVVCSCHVLAYEDIDVHFDVLTVMKLIPVHVCVVKIDRIGVDPHKTYDAHDKNNDSEYAYEGSSYDRNCLGLFKYSEHSEHINFLARIIFAW